MHRRARISSRFSVYLLIRRKVFRSGRITTLVDFDPFRQGLAKHLDQSRIDE